MSIKGYPTQEKVQDKLPAQSITSEFATIQPTGSKRHALDTVSRSAFLVASDAIEAGSTTLMIVATSHSARKGDFIRFTQANGNRYLEIPVINVETNNIYLGGSMLVDPTAADTFDIMRYVTQKVGSDGTISVTSTPGPTQFVLDATDTEVEEDTATPANSKPFPVKILDANGLNAIGNLTETAPASDTASSGLNGRLQRVAQRITSLIALLPASLGQKAKAASLAVTLASDEDLLTYVGTVTESAPASDTASSGLNGRLQRVAQRITSLIALVPTSLGQKTAANSFAVTIASDQSAVASKSPVNSNGSVINGALGTTVAATETAPANAVGFMLMAKVDNTVDIRFRIGGTASTTAGVALQPGRDTGFIPCAANISLCNVSSATTGYELFWILSS